MTSRHCTLLATLTTLTLATVASSASGAATPAPLPTASPPPLIQAGPPERRGDPPGRQEASEPKAYDEVITDEAETLEGLFKTHRIDDKLYFEIPESALEREMLLLVRPVENTAQDIGGFFRQGPRLIVQWERQGDRVIAREKKYDAVADSGDAVWRVVSGVRKGPIIAAFNVETYGPDSAAVVDVTSLYTSSNASLGSIDGLQRDRSWIEDVWAFPGNVEVEATQTGESRRNGAGGGGPPSPFGRGNRGPDVNTHKLHFSMTLLPDEPMMPRLHDKRVGFNSFRFVDFGTGEHRAEEKRYIRRFKLEKEDPDAEISDPVEPIVYWIDPATPEWLRPWVEVGVNKWQEAFEEAGFSNAIFGRMAPTPEEDPGFSLYDARHSVIYWRPSTVPNATGGQIWDPRSGEILKGEVNMYHNIMNLLRNWYFVQVAPLDERARSLPLPDSLMGRLVEYVVTHEIGHSIGFPHNMKASAMYPADSIRDEDFLRRMGHVATLMDYSRMNYVAQPEDDIPPELLVPRIGPYDRFAVMWGYKPVPGAETPQDELDTLDEWARVQDTVPWLRFTTADSDNDPADLTEAVGDADAVQSTTLALRNLERVMDMLIPVAERPGQDYGLLDELYGNAVSQWGRYMRHVAALVGAAETQERYGTGPRFEPVSRERQQEALRFLNERAFDTPEMFIRPEILRRVEAEGVIPRIRRAQSRVLTALIDRDVMDRLVEYEALASEDAYTVADLMDDLRSGVWSELQGSGRVAVDVYRRNLQRAFLEAVDAELNPPEDDGAPTPPFFGGGQQRPAWNSDVRPVLRGELTQLRSMAENAGGRAADSMTRLHLQDLVMEIGRILKANSGE